MTHTGVLPFPATKLEHGQVGNPMNFAVQFSNLDGNPLDESLKVTQSQLVSYWKSFPRDTFEDFCGATPQAKFHKLVGLVFWDVGQHHKQLDLFFSLGRYPTHNFLNTRFRVDISFKGGLILLLGVTSTSPASLVFRRPWLYCHPYNATRQIPKAVDTRSVGFVSRTIPLHFPLHVGWNFDSRWQFFLNSRLFQNACPFLNGRIRWFGATSSLK